MPNVVAHRLFLRPGRLLGAATALLAASAIALAGDVTPPQFVAALPQLKRNPIRWVPQSAILRVRTDEPTQVLLEFDDGVGPPLTVLAAPEFDVDHRRVPVIGMKHGIATQIRVIARDVAGNETVSPQTLTFPARSLPVGFPPLTVPINIKSRTEPGYTMFVTRSGATSWLIVLDEDAVVVWYHFRPNFGGSNVDLLSNGNLMWGNGRHAIEMDKLGRIVGKWYPARHDGGALADADAVLVDTDTFHHEMLELPAAEEADFLALSSELRVYDNYPADEVNIAMTEDNVNVVGDVIVEFKRDGTIVRQTSLLDILDPFRMCYDSLNGFWSDPNTVYSQVSPGIVTRDWAHANAVLLDPSDDTYIVSLRHQDAVVKLERATGQIVWIHGPHERWNAPWSQYLVTPVGSNFEWHYHQHAPQPTPAGGLALFDNGNWRATPPTPPLLLDQSYSRVVEYHIDPVAMTTEMIFTVGSNVVGTPDHFFSRALGDADPMSLTGGYLATAGFLTEVGLPIFHARIAEYTQLVAGVKVFEANVRDPADVQTWTIYRAERIPGLY
jgi:hypothetical protein